MAETRYTAATIPHTGDYLQDPDDGMYLVPTADEVKAGRDSAWGTVYRGGKRFYLTTVLCTRWEE